MAEPAFTLTIEDAAPDDLVLPPCEPLPVPWVDYVPFVYVPPPESTMPASFLSIAGKAIKLGKDAIRFHIGGFSPAEVKQLGADALDLASVVVGTFAPAPIGAIVGDLLAAASKALAGETDLAGFSAALLQSAETAIGEHEKQAA